MYEEKYNILKLLHFNQDNTHIIQHLHCCIEIIHNFCNYRFSSRTWHIIILFFSSKMWPICTILWNVTFKCSYIKLECAIFLNIIWNAQCCNVCRELKNSGCLNLKSMEVLQPQHQNYVLKVPQLTIEFKPSDCKILTSSIAQCASYETFIMSLTSDSSL